MNRLLIAIFIAVQTWVSPVGSFQSFLENPTVFCASVPKVSQIQSYNKCPSAALFTKPLRKMRECCDKGTSVSIEQCLDKLRSREVEINNLFLGWKEPEDKDSQYMQNLEVCGKTYKKLQVQSRGCANKFDPECVDPVGFFEANCTKSRNSNECIEGFVRSMRKGAIASFCTCNSSFTYDINQMETVHHRCFSANAALNRRYESVLNDVQKIEKFCVNEKYGAATDYQVFLDLIDFAGIFYFQMMVMESNHGVYEEIEAEAETFLKDLCETNNINKPLECLKTPVTQTFLTFKSSKQVDSEVKKCCNDNPIKDWTNKEKVEALKSCLAEKDLYQQFYQMGGLFMRGIKRAESGYQSECVRNDAKTDSDFDDLPPSIQMRDYAHELEPARFEKGFKDNGMTMNPINYHFFLRDLAKKVSMSDKYYKAACEACADGENWGKQAYVYPGLMCPALAAKKYYEPIVGMKTCPDLLFYKYQVAHYCCLDSAFEAFNFGENYNPNVCPNMSGVKEIISQ